MKTELIRKVQWMGWLLRRTGPYIALELLLPGGSVFALTLFLIERRRIALARRCDADACRPHRTARAAQGSYDASRGSAWSQTSCAASRGCALRCSRRRRALEWTDGETASVHPARVVVAG